MDTIRKERPTEYGCRQSICGGAGRLDRFPEEEAKVGSRLKAVAACTEQPPQSTRSRHRVSATGGCVIRAILTEVGTPRRRLRSARQNRNVRTRLIVRTRMAAPEEINADMLAFWNGKGGDIWVARQEHTDITLAPVTDALLVFAAPRAGERMVDIGCGCGAPTLEFARAVGPSGRVAGLDISGPMLAEGERRASAAGIANVDLRQADPATAALDEYDLLISAFGVTFFGDRVAAFTNMRRAAAPDARMALVCWRSLAENPWMEVPMTAAAQHLPPRPKAVPNAPGMFAFADRDHVTEVVTAASWAPPRFEKLDMDLDIAAGRGLEEAVVQSTQIGAVNSWLRNQPEEVVSAAAASIHEALAPYADDARVRLPGAMWLISSAPA